MRSSSFRAAAVTGYGRHWRGFCARPCSFPCGARHWFRARYGGTAAWCPSAWPGTPRTMDRQSPREGDCLVADLLFAIAIGLSGAIALLHVPDLYLIAVHLQKRRLAIDAETGL